MAVRGPRTKDVFQPLESGTTSPAVVTQGADHLDPSTRVEGSCASCASLQASITTLEAEMRCFVNMKSAPKGWGTIERWADALALLTRETNDV